MASQSDDELRGLADQFVCVRLVQMGGVDLAIYQFDPFLTWSVFFMNGDKTIYGRFGTASPKAKRSVTDSNPNHTLAGLKAALRKALELHEAYRKAPGTWGKALEAKTGPEPLWRYAEKTPAARKYKRLGRVTGSDTKACVHCHEVQRTAIDSYFMTKRKLPDKMLWVYPHPSILGLTLSKDHCARIEAVAADSIADRAGLEVGDDLLTLGGQPLCSVADAQWVLHNLPDEGGALPAMVSRGNQTRAVTLTLPLLWRRQGDFGWRYRVAGYAMWLWGGVTLADHPDGVRVSHLSPGWFKRPNRDARRTLRRGDIIVEVDGKRGWTRSTYLAYLMREKKLGSRVDLKVLRGGEPLSLTFKVPAKRPEVQGH